MSERTHLLDAIAAPPIESDDHAPDCETGEGPILWGCLALILWAVGIAIVLLLHSYSSYSDAPGTLSPWVLLLALAGAVKVVRDEDGVIVEEIEVQGCAPYYVAHDRTTGKSSFAFMDPDQAFDSLVGRDER